MTIPTADQPINKVREATIDQLVMNYGHEKLSLKAFDQRLEQALDAKEHAQLLALTEDLELNVDREYLENKKREFGSDFKDYGETKDVETMVNVLSGNKRQGQWTVAKEVRIINVLGGDNIDLTEAEFSAPVTLIKIRCVLGGVNIYVPEGIRVKSRIFNVLGGLDNYAPSSNQPNCPTIIIEGFIVLGSVKIKMKTTFKQRLLEFGASVRNFFDPEANQTEPTTYTDKVRSIRERQ